MRESTKRRRLARKLSMMEGFIEAFSEEGLDGAFVTKLAAAAEVSEALLYRYFEDKQDIIRQCTVLYHTQIQQDLTDVITKFMDDPERLPIEILTYIDRVIAICRFLLQVMAHPTYCTMMESTAQQVKAQILEVAELFRQKHAIDEDTAIGASFLLNSITNDYILKKSKENFLAQYALIRRQVWGQENQE